MKIATTCLVSVLASLPLAALAATPVVTLRPELSQAMARQVLAAADGAARAKGLPVAIAIVDDGGHLLQFERQDGVAAGMAEAAVMKGATAAIYGLPTKVLEQAVANGHASYLNLPQALPVEGGLPLVVQGRVVGAIGVAGSQSSAEDAEIAHGGIVALPR